MDIRIEKIDEALYGERTDYSLEHNWLSIPELSKDIDVFYVYPAAYLGPEDEYLPFSKIDDENVIGAAHYFKKMQASAFEEVGNIFIPLYRQFDPRIALKYIEAGKLDLVTDLWSRDIIDSFDYYIKNYNNGRGFILAGHSQGARLLNILLETYLKENKEVYENMVAAYLIGDSVTEEYLNNNPHLRFAESADDTGVIISWNVEMNGITAVNPVLQNGALSINPISWRRDEQIADAKDNLGSLLKREPMVPGIADAQVNLERGSVWCSTVSPKDFLPPMDIFPEGTYHSMDYAFYYNNIKENAATRVKNFLNKNK